MALVNVNADPQPGEAGYYDWHDRVAASHNQLKAALDAAANGDLLGADANGDIKKIESGTYQQALSVVHDVTHPDYGAVGDGATDDGPAFRAAAAAIATAGGGTLFIPATTASYLVDSGPPIDLPEKSAVMGSGNGSLIKRGANYAPDILFKIEGVSNVTVSYTACDFNNAGEFFRYVAFRGSTLISNVRLMYNRVFDSNPNLSTSGDKWAFNFSMGGSSERVWVIGNYSSDDMQLTAGGGDMRDYWVLHNRCENGRANGIALSQRGDDQTIERIEIAHNIVTGVDGNSIWAGPDNDSTQRTGVTVQHINVHDNIVVHNDSATSPVGINVRAGNIARDASVHDNIIVEVAGSNNGQGVVFGIDQTMTPDAVWNNIDATNNTVIDFNLAVQSGKFDNLAVKGNKAEGSRLCRFAAGGDGLSVKNNRARGDRLVEFAPGGSFTNLSVEHNYADGLSNSFTGYVTVNLAAGETLDGLRVAYNELVDAGASSVFGYRQTGDGTYSGVDVFLNDVSGTTGAADIAGGAALRTRWLNRADSGDHAGIPAGELTGTTTWDPGSIADGAVASTTVAVSGAAVGDVVTASHDQVGANDVLLSGHVESAGTVRVVLLNKTGGAFDMASGTLRAVVRKP